MKKVIGVAIATLIIILIIAGIRQDPNNNICLDKSKGRNRIDPVCAMIDSHVRARLQEKEVDLNEYILSDDFSL